MMKISFITISDYEVGYGHLSRCLSLAAVAVHKNFACQFLLFGNKKSSLQIEKSGYQCVLKSMQDFNSVVIIDYLKNNPAETVILDFSHYFIFQNKDNLSSVLKKLRHNVPNLVLIDALDKQAMTSQNLNFSVDFIIQPYIGSESQSQSRWRALLGAKYAILSSEYATLPTRVISPEANNILISCGGSDPKNLTLLVLAGIENVSQPLQIRIIVGPLFDEILKKNLQKIIVKSKHIIHLIDSPNGILTHMLWCDLAIATTGTIKYELAASGTPALLVSIDEVHHKIHREFDKLGVAVDLGVNFTPQLVEKNVIKVLSDYERRLSMSSRGQNAIDGKGSERIITEIMREF